MVELTRIVVEPEQQRRDDAPAAGAKAADDAVCRVVALDLDRRIAASERIRDVALRDDAVQARQAAAQPELRERGILRGRRKPDGRALGEVSGYERLETFAERVQGALVELAAALHEQVEDDVDSRRFLRETRDTACCRMNALQQRVEVGAVVGRDEQLAVDDELPRAGAEQRLDDFGKVARERLARFRLQLDVAYVAKRDA